jgi:hypothetical protein
MVTAVLAKAGRSSRARTSGCERSGRRPKPRARPSRASWAKGRPSDGLSCSVGVRQREAVASATVSRNRPYKTELRARARMSDREERELSSGTSETPSAVSPATALLSTRATSSRSGRRAGASTDTFARSFAKRRWRMPRNAAGLGDAPLSPVSTESPLDQPPPAECKGSPPPADPPPGR